MTIDFCNMNQKSAMIAEEFHRRGRTTEPLIKGKYFRKMRWIDQPGADGTLKIITSVFDDEILDLVNTHADLKIHIIYSGCKLGPLLKFAASLRWKIVEK